MPVKRLMLMIFLYMTGGLIATDNLTPFRCQLFFI